MAEAAHSKFSASAAHRWMACPGSMVLSVGKEDKGSKYAAEGTVAHLMFERCIKAGVTPCDRAWIGETHEVDDHTITVTADMLDAVDAAVANAKEMLNG